MSIPLDRLYQYIENVAQDIRGDSIVIYRFSPHGSKKVEDLTVIRDYTIIETNICPEIICYDQEPLNFELYQHVEPKISKLFDKVIQDASLLPKQNLRLRFGNIYDKCILIHSEKQSANVSKYQENNFIPVYYWSHAVIARDWFRYAEFHQPQLVHKKQFLVYSRAWSGTREYRLKLADLLIENDLYQHCQTSINPLDPETQEHYQVHQYKNSNWIPQHQLENYYHPTCADSSASADFNIDDYNNCDIELVLETLFDDDRIHLTEKVLRPIACGKPFILAAGPGSLNYLRSYGFRTFSGIFDESYDQEVDPVKRLNKIVKSMKVISQWTEKERKTKLKQMQKIADYNKKHFFSNQFLNTVLGELKQNLNSAFTELEQINTSAYFIDFRKQNHHKSEFVRYRKVYRETHGTADLITTLRTARKYYNKHHNK